MDGNFKGNPGNPGFSGILTEEFDNWLASFLECCGFTISLQVELIATFHGLS